MRYSIETTAGHFDHLAPRYTKILEATNYSGITILRNALVDFPGDPKRVLELGPGPGNSLAVIKEHTNPDHIVVVDASSEMLDILREKHADDPRLAVVYSDFNKYLDETTDTFDLVVAMSSLQYIPEIDQTISRIAARLGQGALAMFTYNTIIEGSEYPSEIEYRHHPDEIEAALAVSGLQRLRHRMHRTKPGLDDDVAGMVVAQKPSSR